MEDINVDLNHVDEKASAINAIGIIGMNSPGLCAPRMKEILDTLEELQFYFHENIKFHVALSYQQIGLGLMRKQGVLNAEDKFEWKAGAPAGSPLPVEVVTYLDQIVFPYFFLTFEQEDNKEVIERVFENMREMTHDFGPAVFANQMDRVMKYCIEFLDKKAFCQTLAKGI